MLNLLHLRTLKNLKHQTFWPQCDCCLPKSAELFCLPAFPLVGSLGSGWGGWGDGAGEAVRGKVGSTLAQAIRLSPALRADRITYTFLFSRNWNSLIST